MSRPTRIVIDKEALLHNVAFIKRLAPGRKIIAMVKANAYGCGLANIAPVLASHVDAFGVACLDEALTLRSLGVKTPALLFQGVFNVDELKIAAEQEFSCVIHQSQQIRWLLNTLLSKPISIWIKVNTGMNRLGLPANEVPEFLAALRHCPWVKPDIGLMTHLACADQPDRQENKDQLAVFNQMNELVGVTQRSIANSAAIIASPDAHLDAVRPGIMLYGVSPFAEQSAEELGLKPVMQFISAVSALHRLAPGEAVGYGATWRSNKASIVGIVPVGYGDGYPRHSILNTPVWINGVEVPIIGRISMDMMAIDLTSLRQVNIGDPIELWGTHLPVERIARSSGTSGYELLCQITNRPRGN